MGITPALRVGAALLTIATVASIFAATAAANDLVIGDEDTNGPLIIEPSGTSTTYGLTGSMQAVLFIQRMPAGKTVKRVTLGQFSTPAGCTATTKVRLWIKHHPTHRWRGGSPDRYDLAYADEEPTVTNTPSNLSFGLSDPVPLLKDGTYSFWLQRLSGCTELRQTTWEHPGGLVEGGPPCDYGLPFDDPGNNPPNSAMRLYHYPGVQDVQPECVDDASTGWNISMPGGWLQTHRPGTMQHVHTYTQPPFGPQLDECTGPEYTLKGIRGGYWRIAPASSSYEYVCYWNAFHPRFRSDGTIYKSRNDWFYALPFRTGKPPLDIYVKLETIDYDQYLQRHNPVWAFDAGEQFYPQRVNAFVENFTTFPSGVWHDYDANSLFDGSAERLAAAGAPPGSGHRILTTGMLGSSYLFAPDDVVTATPDDYLDARGSDVATYQADSQHQYYNAGNGGRVYARVVEGSDATIWLQYWVFYYYNSFEHLTKGMHEGDWEMMQVGLNRSTKLPVKATFATHEGAEKCTWSQVTKAPGYPDQPVAFVASRSHATYPRAGSSPLPVGATDNHWGTNTWATMTQDIIAYTNPRWTTWPGRWGSSTGDSGFANGFFKSPSNPSEQGDKWTDPTAFHEGAKACSVGS